jgi:hypothetical protein
VKELRDEAFGQMMKDGRISDVLNQDFRCKFGRVELADEILAIPRDSLDLIKD